MEHEDRPENQNTMSEASSTSPATDPILTKLHARFGLSNTYLPENPSLQALLAEFNSSDWRVRTAVVRQLGDTNKGAEARTLLISALQDPVPAVRAAAARALGDLDDAFPEEPLLHLLHNDTDNDVRTAATQALSVLRERLSPHAVRMLEASFQQANEDDITRSSIIYTLGGLGRRTPIDLLQKGMNDRDWLVREAAALMMGEQEERADEEALEALVSKKEEEPAVIQAAYKALGNLSLYQSDRLARSEVVQVTLEGSPHPAAKPLKLTYALPQRVGNVEFDGIQPGALNIEGRIPITAQAPDNQWVPRTLLKTLLAGHVTLASAQSYLTGLIRTEYLRSLINGERLIMNRAFLYNNSVIARDYMQNEPSREVFKQFLSEGTIIPFLLNEKSPAESPKFTAVPQNLAAWQQICQETRMTCMRSSWLSEEANAAERVQASKVLHLFAQSDEGLNISRLVSDLGLPAEQEPALRKTLSDLHTWSRKIYEQEGRYINREDIYRKYVTSGDPAQRNYDGSKPFAGEIKQLFDLVYNNVTAESLNGYLLTPVDSPTSLILQDWHPQGRGRQYLNADELIQMMSKEVFQVVQSGLYLKSMSMLRLQDVGVIRNTDEWRAYIESLQHLLKAPLEFANRANGVYQNYIKLARVITRLRASRDSLIGGGSLTAEWRPNVKLDINVGGSVATVVWNSDADKPFTNAAEQKKYIPKVTAGSAPVNVRMIIGDSNSSSKLHTSIDIFQGSMHAAQMQWLDLCDQLVKKLDLPATQTQSEHLSNLNIAVGR